MITVKRLLALSGLVAATLATPALAGPYDSLWANSRLITINTASASGGAGVAGTVTNFPVLVRLSGLNTAAGANVLASAGANGSDLRFTDSTGDSALSYQIESWTSASAAIWVKVPAVTGNASTKIRMYWRRAGQATTSSSASVFDTTNGYVGVWHMGGTTTEPDATINGLNGTNEGSVVTSAGLMGSARSFAGEAQAIMVADDARLNIRQNLTLSAWIYSTDLTQSRYILNKGTGQSTNSTSLQYALRDNNANNIIFETGIGANAAIDPDVTTTEVWHSIHATYGGGQARIYLDGALAGSANLSANLNVTTSALAIGWSANQSSGNSANWWFIGSIDEVRVQKTLRDSNWIKLDYQLGKPAATAVALGATFGNTVADVATAVLAAPSGAAGSGQVTVSWTAPASNGGAAISAYTVTSLPGTGTCSTTGALTCNVTGLTPGVLYTFTVKATNSVGVGPASAPATATPTPVGILHEKPFAVSGSKPYTFVIQAKEKATLIILDTYGRAVWSKNVLPSAEAREITWDGKTTSGKQASAGMYMVRATRANGSRFEGSVTLKP